MSGLYPRPMLDRTCNLPPEPARVLSRQARRDLERRAAKDRFQAGDRVQNGFRRATVVNRFGDDMLEVRYDGDEETTFEMATWFEMVMP